MDRKIEVSITASQKVYYHIFVRITLKELEKLKTLDQHELSEKLEKYGLTEDKNVLDWEELDNVEISKVQNVDIGKYSNSGLC